MIDAGLKDLIETHTVVARVPLAPELKVHVATHVTPLWEATESYLESTGIEPPFWAFTWPGGQAIARWLLDNPDTVRNGRILDFGCGNGIQGVAAALSGAARVIANDIDTVALGAARLNAALNDVTLETDGEDLVGRNGAWDIILAGDVCYTREMSDAVLIWLRDQAGRGIPVYLADPGRTFAPVRGLECLETYTVPVEEQLEEKTEMETSVWRIHPD